MSDDFIEARILPRRHEGDVEVARLELYHPDGSPLVIPEAGGGSMVFDGYSTFATDALQTAHEAVPFGNVEITYVDGFEVDEDGSLAIDAPAGAYWVKFAVNMTFPEGEPTAGFMHMRIDMAYVNPNTGNPAVANLGIIEISSQHDAMGYGDFGFDDFPIVKQTVGVAPVAGQIKFTTEPNATDQPVTVNPRITLVKL